MAATIERARDAFRRRAWAGAYELLSEAAAHDPLDARDLERLAISAYLIGNDAESTRAWERAHRELVRRGDVAEAVRCAFWLALALILRGETARAGGWLARAASLVDESDVDCAGRGYLLIPPALEAIEADDAARAFDLAGEATGIARRFGDADLLALARLATGQALIALGDANRGVPLLDEVMVAVTTDEVSPIPAGIVYCAVIEACMFLFDFRRAAEWTAELSRWCDAQPDLVPYRGQCLVHRSQVLQAHGDWSEAIAEADRARLRLSQPPHPAVGIAYYQQAEMHRLRGELVAAEQAYREAARHGRDPEPGMALLRLAEGEVAMAAAAVRRMVDETRDPLARPAILAAAVDVMIAAGDLAAARRAGAELSQLAARIDVRLLHAVSAFANGAVLLATGDARAALNELRRACTAWRDLGMPYDVARARELLGVALRTVGDRDAAEVELDAARSAFVHLGAEPDLRRLTQRMEATVSAPGHGLTARECEVLRLLTSGKTNRDIGAELSISEHTVARHVQNIFTKLGLSSRAAATAYAYEHGLV